jgi:hypothetical protein
MEHSSTAPPPEVGLLDGVEPAQFDMDSLIDEASGKPKQQYDAAFVDPEEGLADEMPPPGGRAMGEKARRATAGAIMLIADRAQAGLFAFFGARGRSDDFRFSKADRAEMVGYLTEGIPDDWELPWWVPFGMVFGMATGANFTKLQEIKAEKKRKEEDERNKLAKEQREERERQEREAEQARYREAGARRQERRRTGTGEPPPADDAEQREQDELDVEHEEQLKRDGLCLECETEPTKDGKLYCSTACRNRANGRKASATHRERAKARKKK